MRKILLHLFIAYFLSITHGMQCFQNDKSKPLYMRTFLNLDSFSAQVFCEKSGISIPSQYGCIMLLQGEIAKIEDRLSKLKAGSPQYEVLNERLNELDLRYKILSHKNTPPEVVARTMQMPIVPYRDSTLKK